MRSHRVILIAAFIIIGILLRVYFAFHGYADIIFDMKRYVDYAHEFLQGFFPMDSRHKNMGYPLFLAIIFWLRGGIDLELIRFIQVALDIIAGLLVWVSAQKIFSRKSGDIALMLYMVNPFTASYVGIILPESLSIFFIAGLLYICTLPNFYKGVLLWFLIGAVLGLLVFLKPGLLFYALGLIVTMSIFSFTKKTKGKFFIVCFLGFVTVSSYTLITNYRSYHKILFTPPYSTFAGQAYVMLFYADRYPEVEFWGVAPELSRLYEEYGSLPDREIPTWNHKYIRLFFQKLQKEPLNFFTHYIKNIVWLWDKDHLSVYSDPWYPTDRYILRIINIMILVVVGFGIIRYLRKKPEASHEPIVVVTLVLVGVMSLWFPIVSNESRHTIPIYPLLFFWAAYGLKKTA